ncbi:hypothetical protein ACWENR_09270 [Micromonospora sp. NPDC004336]
MTDPTALDGGGGAPTTALLESLRAEAAEVVIVEASPDERDRADTARTVVAGGAWRPWRRLRRNSTAPRSCSRPWTGRVRHAADIPERSRRHDAERRPSHHSPHGGGVPAVADDLAHRRRHTAA